MHLPERKVYDPTLDLKHQTEARAKALFLGGPIPFAWIRQACSDPAARLALILRAFMDMEHTHELRVSMKICRYARVSDRHQRQRCLRKLAQTGLFEVSTSQGRSPVAKRLW